MRNLSKILLFLIISLGLVTVRPQLIIAQQPFGPQLDPNTTPGSTATVTIPNPIKCATATCLAAQVIRYILGVIAIIATLMFVWGGVMMLTSGGNADQVRKAKETLVWAAIGVVVIILSWAIIQFVLKGIASG